MWPQLRTNLEELSSDTLRAYIAEIAAAANAVEGREDLSTDDFASLNALIDSATEAAQILNGRQRQPGRLAHIRQLQAEVENTDEDDDAEEVDEAADAESAEEEDEDDGEAAVPAPLPASPAPAQVEEHTPATPESGGLTPARMVVAPGNYGNGYSPGAPVRDWLDVADLLLERHRTLGDGSSAEKFPVISIHADFPEEYRLREGVNENLAILNETSLTAAMCAPVEPYYGLNFESSTVRPLRGSLANYQAPRGGVSVYPSPRLSDISTGYGIWTRTDDANPSATKVACQTIPCADTTDYYIHGVYECLTVTNLLQMTFPELVEQYLNRLTSSQVRLAERTILDQMVAVSTPVPVTTEIYGGTSQLLSRLGLLRSRFEENERYDDGTVFDVWLPRWVRHALRAEIIYRGGGTPIPEIVTDGVISGWFADLGFRPVFLLENPTAAGGDWSPQGAAPLAEFPCEVWMVVTTPGNFRLMDRGRLDIGVAPGNIYRDNASNTVNQFTMFLESFEGLLYLGGPSWYTEIAVDWNGTAFGAAPTAVTLCAPA